MAPILTSTFCAEASRKSLRFAWLESRAHISWLTLGTRTLSQFSGRSYFSIFSLNLESENFVAHRLSMISASFTAMGEVVFASWSNSWASSSTNLSSLTVEFEEDSACRHCSHYSWYQLSGVPEYPHRYRKLVNWWRATAFVVLLQGLGVGESLASDPFQQWNLRESRLELKRISPYERSI